MGTLQLDRVPESSVSDWLLKDREKNLTARLAKDETVPNLLLCFKGFVHFATSAAKNDTKDDTKDDTKEDTKDDTKDSLQQGDYSTVGEASPFDTRGCGADLSLPRW